MQRFRFFRYLTRAAQKQINKYTLRNMTRHYCRIIEPLERIIRPVVDLNDKIVLKITVTTRFKHSKRAKHDKPQQLNETLRQVETDNRTNQYIRTLFKHVYNIVSCVITAIRPIRTRRRVKWATGLDGTVLT